MIHHVFKQWTGRLGLYGVNDRLSLWAGPGSSERIRLAVLGHRGHITHIKAGWGVRVRVFGHGVVERERERESERCRD